MRRSAAVTLAELVLSFFLMLLVVILIFQLYPMALSSVRLSGQRVQAGALAESVLSDWMEKPFTDLVVGPEQALPPVPGRGVRFEAFVQVLPVDQPGINPSRIRAVRVRVSWESHGVRREIVRERWRTNVLR